MGYRAKNVIVGCVAFATLAIAPHKTNARSFIGTGPGDGPGETLQAAATFTISNLDLVVTLANTSTFDPNDAPDILTGIFFTIDGDPSLTPLSAQLAPGSLATGRRLPIGFTGNVGSQWAYRNALTGAPLNADEGISSTGLKWFGKKNLFPGQSIAGSKSLNGVQFGLTSAFDLPGNDRSGIKNQNLIDNSTVFTFGGLPEGFALTDISNVTFQYGTTSKDPELFGTTVVPEPTTIILVGAGLLVMFTLKRLA